MAKKYYRYEETHRTVKGVKQKLCTKCVEWKGESKFHKDRARKDGLKIRCTACERVYHQELAGKDGSNIREYLRFEERHRAVRGVKQKLCSRCKKWSNESHFYRNPRLKDGLASYCKECHSKYVRKRYKQIKKAGRKKIRNEDSHRLLNGVWKKLCSKCKSWKGESNFYKDSSKMDGLKGRCKKCSYKAKATGKSRKKRSVVKN